MNTMNEANTETMVDEQNYMQNLEEVMQETIRIKEDEFFSRKFYYSYSSLNKLMWNPQAFYQMYVMGIREERLDAHLVQGKLIHLLLLQPEKFEQEFMLTPNSLPTGNLRVVLDRVFHHHRELHENGSETRVELSEYANAVLDVMRDMNYFQNLKTDQQRLEKVMTPEALSYWEFLLKKGNKMLIDEATYKFCTDTVQLITKDPNICELIGLNVTEFDNIKVFNELEMQLDIPNKAYGIKGIIDNIVVDHDKKVIRINDIKTSSKDLKDFPESVEYYSYWLQAIIYLVMVGQMFVSEITQQGYTLEFRFVVIDRTYQVYPFTVKESTLKVWLDRFTNTMTSAHWHYENRDYNLPYDFAIGSITL